MAKNNDFFVSFGSNAEDFASDLIRELNPVRRAVSAMQLDMQKIVNASRASRQAAETAAAAAAKAGNAADQARGGGGSGTSTSPGGQTFDTSFFAGLRQDLAMQVTSTQEVINKMTSAAELMQKTAKTFKPAANKITRGEAQNASPTSQANTGLSFVRGSGVVDTLRKGGPRAASGFVGDQAKFNPQRYTHGGKPLTWNDIQQFLRAPAVNAPGGGGGGGVGEVTFKGTPEVVIREASFGKIVKAIEKGNQYAKGTKTTADAILAHLRSGGGGGGGGSTVATPSPTAPRPSKPDTAKANQTNLLLEKRKRLADVKRELERVQTGGEYDAALAARAAGGSTKLQAVGAANNYQGEQYTKRLEGAIKSLTSELKGVKRAKGLRAELESGAPVASAPAAVASAAPRATAKAEELDFGKLAQIDSDIAQIKAHLKGATGDVADAARSALETLTASRKAMAKELGEATKEAGLTKAQAKDARRVAAAEVKAQSPSKLLKAQQRRDTARDLALGESPAHLNRANRAELERIARSFGQEGYALPYDPSATKHQGERITNDVLRRDITAARARFDEAGGETTHDLRVSDKVVATEVGPNARRMIKSIAKVMKRTAEEAEALEKQVRNREGGGQGQNTLAKGGTENRVLSNPTAAEAMGLDRAGRLGRGGKVAKGNVMRGQDFATSAGRDEIREAEAIEAQYKYRTQKGSLAQALTFARVGGEDYNPHDPAVAAEIKGKGPEAKEARDNLRALRRATAAIDKVTVDFIKLDDQVKKLDRASARLAAEDDKLAKLAAPTSADEDRRRAIAAEQTDLGTRRDFLTGRRDALMLGPNVPAYELANDPSFRKGAVTRAHMWDTQQAQAAEGRKTSRDEYEANQAVRGGLFDALFGSRMKPWIGSGREGSVIGPESYTRAFPGVRISNQNGLQAMDPSSVDPKLRKVADKALRKYATALERSLEQGLHPTEQAQRVIAATKAAEAWVESYDKLGAGIRKAAIDPRTGMLTYTGNEGDILRPQAGIKSPQGERPLVPERKLDDIRALLEGAPAPQTTDRNSVAALLGIKDLDVFEGPEHLRGGPERQGRERLYDMRANRALAQSAPQERAFIQAITEASKRLRDAAKATKTPAEMEIYRTNPQALLAALPAEHRERMERSARNRTTPLEWQISDIESGKRGQRLEAAERMVADPQQMDLFNKLSQTFAGIDDEAKDYARTTGDVVRAKQKEKDATELATRAENKKKKERDGDKPAKKKPEPVASKPPAGAGGGGDKGGDGGAAAAPLVPAGGNNIFERILKRLEMIHTTLRTGVVTKAGVSAASGAARNIAGARRRTDAPEPTRTASTAAATAGDDAAAYAAAEDQRNKAKTNREKAQQAKSGVDKEALSAANLAVTYGRLSSATKKYAEELRALHAANAPQAQINAKQVQLYTAMNAELGKLQVSSRGIRASFKEVVADTGGKINEYGINQIARSSSVADTSGRRRGLRVGAELGEGMGDGAMDAFASRLFGNSGFWSRVMNSTGTFIVRNFTAGFVFGITAALQDVIAQAIETESTFVRVSHALESTGRSAAGLRADLQDISTDYGVALLDVYNTAAGLTGLFQENEEIAGATRVVAQLQMISNGALNAQEAMGALASISSAFGMTGVEGLEHVADVLTTVQNRLGVNLEVSAEGVGRLAGLANQLELSFEETAVYVAEIAKRTNQTGAAAGEQFSRIVSVMQTGRGQKVLEENLGDQGIGVALNTGNYSDAIRILMENYGSLTEAQQDNIAVTLGGQRQAASLAALLSDGATALDTVAAAQYSRGAADERAAKIAETLNNQLKIMQSNFVNLGAALVQSGILSFFAKALQVSNFLFGTLNDILATANDFASRNPFVNFLKTVAVGALGAVLALRLVRASIAGVRAAMKADTVMGAVTRGAVGPLTGAPGAQPGEPGGADERRKTRRERMSAAWQRGNLNVVTGGGFFSRESRLPDPNVKSAGLLGRNLERVTAGPLRAFSTGLSRLSTAMQNVALNQMTVGGADLDRAARRSYGYSRAAGAGSSFFGRAARVAELTVRGRGDIIADRAASSLRTGQTALQLRALAAEERVAQRARIRSQTIIGPDGRTTPMPPMGARGSLADAMRAQASGAPRVMQQQGTGRFATASTGIQNAILRTQVRAQGALPGGMSARGFNALATGMGGVAKGMSGLATGLRAVAFGGAAAQGAMAGLSLVLTAVIMEMVRAEQFAKDVENAYKARFTEEGRAGDDEKAERYVGPNTDLSRANREGLGGFSGYMRALGDTYKGIFTDPIGLITGDVTDRSAGVIPEDQQGDLDAIREGFLTRFQDSAANLREGNLTLDEIQGNQTDLLAQIDAEAAEINSSDMSAPQKAAALAELESIAKFVDDTAGSLALQLEGLSTAEHLSITRIQEISSLAGSLAGSPTAGLNYGSAMEAVMNAQGGAPGSRIQGSLEAINAGGSQADILRSQLSVNDQLVSQATARLNTATEDEDIKERSNVLLQLMATGEQLRRQIADAEAAAATEMATFLASSGDYGGAAAVLDQAAAKARARVAASRAQRERNAAAANDPARFFNDPNAPKVGAGVLANAPVMGEDEEIAALNKAAQLEAQANENAVTEATRTDQLALRGNRNAVRVADIQLRIANQRVATLKEREASDQEIFAAEDAAAQAALAAEDAAMALAGAMDQANIAGIRGSQARAQAERVNAERALQRLRDAGYGENSVEVQGAIASLKGSRIATADAEQARVQSTYQMQAAGQLNSVTRARTEEAGAWQAVANAKKAYGVGTSEYNAAVASARAASQATTQAVEDEAAAMRDYQLAIMPPGDMQGRAAQTLSNALAAQAAARKFGTSSSQYHQATIAVIEAQRGVDEAAYQMLQGQQAINLAMLEYGGHTVEAARERVRQAESALQRALQLSGGADSPDVRNARAGVISAKGAERDTVFQDQMNSIDYQQQMDQITARGAIGLLQQLLNMKDLTEEQRRSVLLKIKGLQDELSSTMEGVFNLPGEIKVPTPYEVRRAIGVDDYISAMKDATSTSAITSAMPSASNPNQILREIQGALAAGSANSVAGAVQDYSNSNNNVTINGASFEQVVAYLNQYLGAGAQVVRTNAGRKGY